MASRPTHFAPVAPVASPAATLLVSEIYTSIQGESTHAGRPCVFIRLTGCPLRCVWCDSAFAFAGGERLAIGDILARAASFGLNLVEVTGGEPLAQPGCIELIRRLCDAGHETLLETSGACDIAPVDARAAKIVDVKCPGSGESARNRWSNLDLLGPRDEIKMVLADRADYEYGRSIIAEHDLIPRVPVHFAPVFGKLDPAELARWILGDKLDVRLQLQLHKSIWPGRERGV